MSSTSIVVLSRRQARNGPSSSSYWISSIRRAKSSLVAASNREVGMPLTLIPQESAASTSPTARSATSDRKSSMRSARKSISTSTPSSPPAVASSVPGPVRAVLDGAGTGGTVMGVLSTVFGAIGLRDSVGRGRRAVGRTAGAPPPAFGRVGVRW
jgi:hypothetical protein